MYELKVLAPKFSVPEVNCIYKVKKIGQFAQELCNSSAQKECGFDLNILEKKIQLATSSEMAIGMIAERQMQVIQQLEALEAKLVSIREKCKLNAPLPVTTSKQQLPNRAQAMQSVDFVVKLHPNQVPYALLALRNLWKNEVNLEIKMYKHSSMPKIGKEAQYFEQQLEALQAVNKTLATIKITLIWMDCEQTEMTSSAAHYMPIYGEVNILRYLARLGATNLHYEDLSVASEIDALLDVCHQVLRLRTPAARKDLLTAIAARLGNEFLFDKEITLADIMVYCTIKQAVPAKDLNFATKDLNTQFKAWRSRVERTIDV